MTRHQHAQRSTPGPSGRLPAVPDSEFLTSLREGLYLGTLETYGVQWSMEKVARDTLQNFYDAHLSLEGIDIQVEKSGIPMLSRRHTIRISGNAEYPFQKLLHYGGTDKAGRKDTAGGFGEGTKIVALVLLRDYGFEQVRYQSGSWQLDFYFAPPPQGSYDQDGIRGLYAKLTDVPHQAGNRVEFVTTNARIGEVFIGAKNYFYHPGNPDFVSPSLEIDMPGGGQTGFKLLANPGRFSAPEGHLYDAGQMRHYKYDSSWRSVSGMHIWTRGWRAFHVDRDRGIVTDDAFDQKLLRPFVRAMRDEHIQIALDALTPLWPHDTGSALIAEAPRLLERVIDEAAQRNLRYSFSDTLIAVPLGLSRGDRELLRGAGFTLCRGEFAQIGMRTPKGILASMKEKVLLTPTPTELERIRVLQESVSMLVQRAEHRPEYRLGTKDVRLFAQKDANSNLLGEHEGRFVWMSRERLGADYASALSTYLHEIQHDHGRDTDREFGYALTDTLRVVIDVLTRYADDFKPLLKRWHRAEAP